MKRRNKDILNCEDLVVMTRFGVEFSKKYFEAGFKMKMLIKVDDFNILFKVRLLAI